MKQDIFQSRDPFRFDSRARWIWLSKGARPENQIACFRKTFDITSVPSSAKLNITADARHEVYVNGQFMGHGPVRSWPEIWSVDEYDIAPMLRRGKNVVSVLVIHWGISTFQYINAEPDYWRKYICRANARPSRTDRGNHLHMPVTHTQLHASVASRDGRNNSMRALPRERASNGRKLNSTIQSGRALSSGAKPARPTRNLRTP